MSKQLVGLVGWRGMVGSVLMGRMQAEGDFDLIEPIFFSTSNAGGKAPAMAKAHKELHDANDVAALTKCDLIISCQGGDYTKDVFPKVRAAGCKATGLMPPAPCACKTMRSSSSTRSMTI